MFINSKYKALLILFLCSVPMIAVVADAEEFNISPEERPDECKLNLPQVRTTVNNVKEGGLLAVELYNGPENFLRSKGRLKRIRIPATAGTHTVCFDLKEHGRYAVASYHDEDGNWKMNRKWNMMPKEAFGLSLNPELRFGFPKFSDSAFTTENTGADITIDLQHP